MASCGRILQNLSRISAENTKYKECSNRIDSKLFAFINNNLHSTQQRKELYEYLKQQKNELLCNINEHNKRKSSLQHKISTPNRFNSNTKSRFSSKQKIRPKFRKTPLKICNLSNSNNQNIQISDVHIANKENLTKIPPKKLNLDTLYSRNANNVETAGNVHKKLCFDDDSDSEMDEQSNSAPVNLMNIGSKSMVQMKLEQIEIKKKSQKPKKKVGALERAKMARMEHEKRERQRKEQKEANKRAIAENKRKREQLQLEKSKKMHQRKNANASIKKMQKFKKSRPIVKKTRMKPRNAANGHNHAIKKVIAPLREVKNKVIAKKEKEKESESVKVVKPRKKTEEQYQLSDYDSDFSESDLDEDNCPKFIPQWAKKKNPSHSIARQKCIDPDTIFGKMWLKTCDLEEVFKDYPSRTKYRQRSSSGDWSRDIISWPEERAYKKDMGWI